MSLRKLFKRLFRRKQRIEVGQVWYYASGDSELIVARVNGDTADCMLRPASSLTRSKPLDLTCNFLRNNCTLRSSLH